MITYDSNAKVFHLQTNETSYLILLYQDQIPMHVYWGNACVPLKRPGMCRPLTARKLDRGKPSSG